MSNKNFCSLPPSKTNTCVHLVSLVIPLLVVLCLCVGYSDAVAKALDREAYTIYYNNKTPNKDGDYNFDFQTSNGITVKGAGNVNGAVGAVQYVSPEGLPITWTYVADSDGYHPTGDHIPMRPEYVDRALEYIRTHPQVNEEESRKL
ncbi:pupal cuticle protein Edg-78E isoform X1 [Musca domestica]|uniref:Pupal cuticle protein Edg-78E isoform X1 n=1 Tax=Musca domestica TaxID=7370 RepID=A0A9J7IHS3_MUSDO|nr:pupal cuticle protein Edg-78E isoform X1 [Musca domestica]